MRYLILKFFLFIKIIFRVRLRFFRPKKSNILIYDGESINELNFFLKNKKFEIFYNRYEELNIYVLSFTILKKGFKKLRYNYKLNFFKFVAPKLVLTIIDHNHGFYKLKSMYPLAKYVSIEIFFKDNNFYKNLNYLKKRKKEHNNLEADISFVLGKNEVKFYSKYIKSKYIVLGSLRNNNFFLKKKYKKKIKKILFISDSLNRLKNNKKNSFMRSVKVFKFLEDFCKKKKLKLYLLSKHGKDTLPIYREYFGKGNWRFIPRLSTKNTYKEINKADFVVFTESTLGFEALSKKIKGVFFPEEFPYKKYPYKKHQSIKNKNSGIFWSKKINKKIIYSKIEKLISLSNSEWKKIIDKEINDIIIYNPKNKIFLKKIKKIVK